MKRAVLLPAAFLLDQLAGDPEWMPHPVRLMGLVIKQGEKIVRREGDNPVEEIAAGVVLTLGLVAGSYFLTRAMLRCAYRRSPWLGTALEVGLAWTCIASRNLQQEAEAVVAALEADDLALARLRVARIVGRDTKSLDASEISRALIETLAESASDGVVAPLFYLALGGAPLGMAYKAVNTLDSMIGHRDGRYCYFGKAAARLDDVANLLPARLTALGFVAVAPDARAAWSTWLRDGDKHKSPNAGQPEAAMAGALHVVLGGENRYDGEVIASPRMGPEYGPASVSKARMAMQLTMGVALFGLACGVVLAAARGMRAR
jgi:adenosylcobinamide-phosphate synthase